MWDDLLRAMVEVTTRAMYHVSEQVQGSDFRAAESGTDFFTLRKRQPDLALLVSDGHELSPPTP
jgi:hypothetical protein